VRNSPDEIMFATKSILHGICSHTLRNKNLQKRKLKLDEVGETVTTVIRKRICQND